MLCKEACSAKDSVLQRSAQRRVLCKEACSAKKCALQRSVLCKGQGAAKERAKESALLCRALSFAEHASLQSTLLCRARFFAEHSPLRAPLQHAVVLCKEARKEVCSAKKRALQRTACCKGARKGECSAKKRANESALQRSVLCKGACSAKKCSAKTRKLTGPLPFTAPEADWPSCSPQNKNRRRTDPTPKLTGPPSPFTARKHVCRACSAKKCALQRSVLCKGQRAAKERAKKRALQRSVLCKEACSAKKRALQRCSARSVLCKGSGPGAAASITGRPSDVERLLDEAGQRALEVERGAEAIEETAAVAAEEGEVRLAEGAAALAPTAGEVAGTLGAAGVGAAATAGLARGHCGRCSLRSRTLLENTLFWPQQAAVQDVRPPTT